MYVCVIVVSYYWIGDVDFNSTSQVAVIPAGTNFSVVNITVFNDEIVEGNETFTMNLNTSHFFDPGVKSGDITMATAIIMDVISKSIITVIRIVLRTECMKSLL